MFALRYLYISSYTYIHTKQCFLNWKQCKACRTSWIVPVNIVAQKHTMSQTFQKSISCWLTNNTSLCLYFLWTMGNTESDTLLHCWIQAELNSEIPYSTAFYRVGLLATTVLHDTSQLQPMCHCLSGWPTNITSTAVITFMIRPVSELQTWNYLF
jgi:hypothetical protein